jgi:hypothetical protein
MPRGRFSLYQVGALGVEQEPRQDPAEISEAPRGYRTLVICPRRRTRYARGSASCGASEWERRAVMIATRPPAWRQALTGPSPIGPNPMSTYQRTKPPDHRR